MSSAVAAPDYHSASEVVYVFMRFLVFLAVALFAAGSMSISFLYESQTLWYKVGLDKTMLRAGQLAGLLAAALLVLQVLSGSRAKILTKTFGLADLMRYHRRNGLIIGGCVILHVLLVLAPEGLTNLPIGMKYWPEMVGILLFWVVLSMVVSSHYRDRLKLVYSRWKLMHKILASLTGVLLPVHVNFVSDSFENAVPRAALFTTFLLLILFMIRHNLAARFASRS